MKLMQKQNGVVLVAALVVLLILTLIGVTIMNMTTLEEKMAINMQLKYSSFNIAETGINHAIVTPTSINLAVTEKLLPDLTISSNTKAVIKTRFRQMTAAPIAKSIDDIYSATNNLKAAYFDIDSTGHSGPHAKTTLRAGIYQIAPGS